VQEANIKQMQAWNNNGLANNKVFVSEPNLIDCAPARRRV
jgi:hypothetical protein